MNKKFYLAEENIREDLGEGIKRQLLGYDEKIMMVRVDFSLNSVGRLHHHIHSQSSYVLSGIFEVTINGETMVLKKGDSFFVPTDQTHGVICREAGSLLDVFTPAREDFLPLKD
jgi:quercetin dioxygenase-like cupin family protein